MALLAGKLCLNHATFARDGVDEIFGLPGEEESLAVVLTKSIARRK